MHDEEYTVGKGRLHTSHFKEMAEAKVINGLAGENRFLELSRKQVLNL
jgi:hypothetical protein